MRTSWTTGAANLSQPITFRQRGRFWRFLVQTKALDEDITRGTAAGAEDLPRMVFRPALLALFEQAPAWIAVLQYAVAAAFTVAVCTVVVLPFFIARDEDSRDGSQ